MFGLGMVKGTIIGMGIGLLTGLALKEICKMKKNKKSLGESKKNKDIE